MYLGVSTRCKFANSWLCSSTSSERRQRTFINRPETPPLNLNSAKPSNLKMASYMVISYMSSCNVQNSPQGFLMNCSKASRLSEFHSKQTTAVCVNQFYLSLQVTMADGMIDQGIHIALMGSSFMSQITTSLNKLVPMLRIEQIKGASCPLTKGIMLDYEGWCLSSCRSSVAEHWQLKPRV